MPTPLLNRLPVLVVFLMISTFLQAQSLWIETAPKEIPSNSPFYYLDNEKDQVLHFDLDVTGLVQVLAQAPLENTGSTNELLLQLPLATGTQKAFRITEYTLYTDGVHTGERTYYGTAADDPSIRVRADLTAHGFRAMFTSEDGVSFVEPMLLGTPEAGYISFAREGLESLNGFNCSFDPTGIAPDKNSGGTAQRSAGDCTFRSYRLAIATTGEYSNYFGATSSAQSSLVSAGVVTTVNRVNGVFESESAIRLNLLGNTANSFYYSPTNDPYTDGNAGAMLNQNTPNLNAVYGSGAYDIGHVFGADGGNGVAYLRSVCGVRKGGGVTLRDIPVGDPFDIDYVAHEMGHQFGGNHTQNNSCQRNPGTAYEPGSASTIMGYAGICSPNVQNNSDPYFHAISLTEMGNFVTGNIGNGCATIVPSSNSQPVVSAGTNIVLPQGTPFALTATGSDPNGDALTYQWEHYDNGIATMPPSPTSTTGPNFRSLTPTASPTRFFPDYANVVSGTSNIWEVLPTVARSSTFRVIARDNQAGGCTQESDIVVTWSANGPFSVTSPNANTNWVYGQSTTLTWAVNGTNAAPISCPLVDLELSFDGGQTFNTTVATGVANNGSYTFTVPSSYPTSNQARIRATCSDGRFYNLSGIFSISATAPTIQCQTFSSVDLPKDIGPNQGTITTSTVAVSVPAQATDINVVNVQGTHSFVADLEMDIISPSNVSRRLMYDPCNSQNNFSLSFDSETNNAYGSWPCPPTSGLSYQPLDNLNTLYTGVTNGNWTLRITDDANSDGGTLTNWGVEVCFDLNVPLPVELTAFNAKPTNEQNIAISWSTSSEIDADEFEVLRWKETENNNFNTFAAKVVSQVAAKNPNGATYDALDTEVEQSATYYYQLAQKDLDGSINYSDVVSVTVGSSLSAKPNIREQADSWIISGLSPSVNAIQLVDALGREIRSYTSTSQTLSIPKTALTVGWYAIVIDGEATPLILR